MGFVVSTLRSLARELRQRPGFLLVAVITLGVGIGANVAIFSVLVVPMLQDVVGDVERVLWVLLGSVGCILLIACANVANLFLVRAEGRQREVAVRAALGASRGDVALLFLGESVALSLLGGLLGLALAWAGVRLLVSLRPEGIPRLDEIGVDGRALLFTLLLALVSGALCGAFAALRYGSPALAAALKDGGRGGTAGRERQLARNVLVVFQVALLLGGVGIYGVVSYGVSQRTREIGVRMALGAKRDDISIMVLRQGLGVTLLGIALGLVCALLVTRLILALLYGVSPTDPATLAAVPVLLAAVALLACWVPARRAASVEPLEAIRAE